MRVHVVEGDLGRVTLVDRFGLTILTSRRTRKILFVVSDSGVSLGLARGALLAEVDASGMHRLHVPCGGER